MVFWDGSQNSSGESDLGVRDALGASVGSLEVEVREGMGRIQRQIWKSHGSLLPAQVVNATLRDFSYLSNFVRLLRNHIHGLREVQRMFSASNVWKII